MSSALADYPLEYEDMPLIKPERVGRTFKKMSSKAKAAEPTTGKQYNKSRGEHFKDMLIVALVVGIIAFVGGMQFAKGNQAEIDRAVQAAQPSTQAVATDVKK